MSSYQADYNLQGQVNYVVILSQMKIHPISSLRIILGSIKYFNTAARTNNKKNIINVHTKIN